MSVKIDQGEGKFLSLIKDLINSKKKGVDVGFFKEAVYPDGVQVAAVAIYNEYGSISKDGKSLIPPRPFLSDTAKKSPEWMDKLQKLIKNQGTKIDIEKALSGIGRVMVGDIQKTISKANSLYVGNAPSTIARKGKDSVLRDTLTLLQSVESRVSE